jgi:hypothetical protein
MSGWPGVDFSTYGPDEAVRYSRHNAQTPALETFTIADSDGVYAAREIASMPLSVGAGRWGAAHPEKSPKNWSPGS